MHLIIPVETLVFAVFGGLCVVDLFASMSVLELVILLRLTLLASIVYALYTSLLADPSIADSVRIAEPLVCNRCPTCCTKQEVATAEPEPETDVYERELEPTTEFSDLIRNPL